MIWSFFNRKKAEYGVGLTTYTGVKQEFDEHRDARKSATSHPEHNNYAAAVSDLDRLRAMETANGSEAQPHSEIRRAKYLQKAQRGPEGWQIYEELLAKNRNDLWVLIDIFDAMRLHLQRENEPSRAIEYGIAHRLARVKLYREMKAEAHATLAEPAESQGSKQLAGFSIASASQWLSELTDPVEVCKLIDTLCKKSGRMCDAEALTAQVTGYIQSEIDPLSYLEDNRFPT